MIDSKVYVAYVSPEQQFYAAVTFVEGMTAADAIAQSGLLQQVVLPEHYELGIFGVKIDNEQHRLASGDRVEIYRPLIINPKDIRRHRAAKNPVGRYASGHRLKQLK